MARGFGLDWIFSTQSISYSVGHVGRRFVGGWVSGYVWYLELSRDLKHVAQQMRYQNVDLSNGHCLGTTIIF